MSKIVDVQPIPIRIPDPARPQCTTIRKIGDDPE